MDLLRKFGSRLKPAFFESALRSSQDTRLTDKLIPAVKGDLLSRSCYAAMACYCSDQRERAWTYGAKCLDYGEDYFFGEWRARLQTDDGNVDPAWWRRVMPWVDRFRYSVCWALVLKKPEFARRLAEYPRSDSWGKDLAERNAFYCLACFMRGEMDEISQNIQGGRLAVGEKARHVAAVVRSLLAKDQNTFQKVLEDYLVFFRSREFDPNVSSKLLCLDGTTFMWLGRFNGLDFQVPTQFADFIIC